MFRKAIITLTVGCIVFVASACNTVKGVGRDIESVGTAGAKAMR